VINMMELIGKAALRGLGQSLMNNHARKQQRATQQSAAEENPWERRYYELEAVAVEASENARKNLQTAVINSATIQGLVAQREALKEALKAAVPNHPLLQETEHRSKTDNSRKTKLRLIFEAAFDAEWVKKVAKYAFLNKDPKAHRQD